MTDAKKDTKIQLAKELDGLKGAWNALDKAKNDFRDILKEYFDVPTSRMALIEFLHEIAQKELYVILSANPDDVFDYLIDGTTKRHDFNISESWDMAHIIDDLKQGLRLVEYAKSMLNQKMGDIGELLYSISTWSDDFNVEIDKIVEDTGLAHIEQLSMDGAHEQLDYLIEQLGIVGFAEKLERSLIPKLWKAEKKDMSLIDIIEATSLKDIHAMEDRAIVKMLTVDPEKEGDK